MGDGDVLLLSEEFRETDAHASVLGLQSFFTLTYESLNA